MHTSIYFNTVIFIYLFSYLVIYKVFHNTLAKRTENNVHMTKINKDKL